MMGPRLGYVLAVAALLVAASAADGQVDDPRWLVWLDDGRRPRSFEVDADGRPRRERSGIEIAVDGEPWRLVRSEWTAAAAWCDDVAEPPWDEVRGFQLDAVSETRTRTLVETFDEHGLSGLSDFHDSLEVVASIGATVVVHRVTAYQGECSMHLYHSDEYAWIDLRSGEAVDVVREVPAPIDAAAAAQRRLCQELLDTYPPARGLARGGPEDRCAAERDTGAERDAAVAAVREILISPDSSRPVVPPLFDPTDLVPELVAGAWRVHHRFGAFVGDCCPGIYVVTPEASDPPARFAPSERAAPAPVRRFLRRFPGARRLGFSQLR